MPDLLPCAFCGSSDIECPRRIVCRFCGGSAGSAEAWNRRVTPASDDGVSQVLALLREPNEELLRTVRAPNVEAFAAQYNKTRKKGERWEVTEHVSSSVIGAYGSFEEAHEAAYARQIASSSRAKLRAIASYIEEYSGNPQRNPAGSPPEPSNDTPDILKALADAELTIECLIKAKGAFDVPHTLRQLGDAIKYLRAAPPSDDAKPTPDLLRWRGAFKGMPKLDEDPSEPVGSLSAELAELRAIPGWDGPDSEQHLFRPCATSPDAPVDGSIGMEKEP